MWMTTLEHWQGEEVEWGEFLVVTAVRAANVVSDIRENLRNLVGGRMSHYEDLIQNTVTDAMEKLEARAKEKGYDGVGGIKIAHPTVVEGGVEVIIYGNGFCYKKGEEQA